MMPIHRILFPTLLCAGLVGGSSLRALPVDFTPKPYEYHFDGATFHGVKLIHGDERISYILPLGWKCWGDRNTLSMRLPEAVGNAWAEISHKENTPPPTWDQEGIDALLKRAQALLPPVAQEVKVTEVCKNPLQMRGHDTIRFNFTGQMMAQSYQFIVVLLPLEDEQFGFVMYGEKKDYESAATSFMSSLGSLRWEKAGP